MCESVYSLSVSNFLMIVSIRVVLGATWPRRTGILWFWSPCLLSLDATFGRFGCKNKNKKQTKQKKRAIWWMLCLRLMTVSVLWVFVHTAFSCIRSRCLLDFSWFCVVVARCQLLCCNWPINVPQSAWGLSTQYQRKRCIFTNSTHTFLASLAELIYRRTTTATTTTTITIHN